MQPLKVQVFPMLLSQLGYLSISYFLNERCKKTILQRTNR